MTFEEDFPSLTKNNYFAWHKAEIKKYCFDKQKVKDAYNKLKEITCKDNDCEICNLIKDFEKELFVDER